MQSWDMVAGTQRARGRRVHAAIALTTAILVVACGVLAHRHEALVAHVIAADGTVVHTQQSACTVKVTAVPHLHTLPGSKHHDPGECVLLVALPHTAAVTHDHALVANLPVGIARALAASASHHVQTPLLHTAPKTSPPQQI